SGRARLEIAADTLITTDSGPARVRLALVHGPAGRTPAAVWIDEDDELFASDVGWFITVRRGAEQTLPVLREIEVAYRDAQGEALARELIPAPVTAIAIVDGDVFDAESGTLRPGTAFGVRGVRSVTVGPSDSLEAPPGATVIDAAGKGIVPGLWEMHPHLQLSTPPQAGLVQLARGITTSRDFASDIDVAGSY